MSSYERRIDGHERAIARTCEAAERTIAGLLAVGELAIAVDIEIAVAHMRNAGRSMRDAYSQTDR